MSCVILISSRFRLRTDVHLMYVMSVSVNVNQSNSTANLNEKEVGSLIDVNNFHYMKIGLASPEKSVLGHMVK